MIKKAEGWCCKKKTAPATMAGAVLYVLDAIDLVDEQHLTIFR